MTDKQEPVACKGIPRKGCNYLAYADTVCNKCGEVHRHHQMLAHFYAAPPAQPAEPAQPQWHPEWPAFVEYWAHESHLQTFADRERFRLAVKEMLATAQAADIVPPGYVVVPVEPTWAMCEAAKKVPEPNKPYPVHFHLIWDAMIAAAQSAPKSQS